MDVSLLRNTLPKEHAVDTACAAPAFKVPVCIQALMCANIFSTCYVNVPPHRQSREVRDLGV